MTIIIVGTRSDTTSSSISFAAVWRSFFSADDDIWNAGLGQVITLLVLTRTSAFFSFLWPLLANCETIDIIAEIKVRFAVGSRASGADLSFVGEVEVTPAWRR